MEYRVLGPLEVVANGDPVDAGPRKQRMLLALLLIHANRVVSTDRILEDLWGDDAEGKHNALWVYISRLRAVLGHESIAKHDHGYSLVTDAETIDAHRFEVAASEARGILTNDAAAASAMLRDALDMWRGAAYEGFGDEAFARTEVTRLEELRLDTIADRIDADLTVGEASGLVSELESLVQWHPLDERFVGQLMTALYRSGRTAQALAAYERIRRTLSEELGIEPSRMLQLVEQQVLSDEDPADAPTGAPRQARTHNLPAELSTFVGRETDVNGVAAAVEASRLVTITGIGGVGKTRLALHVASNLTGRFADGVWLARLASASGPAQVNDLIVDAVGQAPTHEPDSFDAMARDIAELELLVVLDNCEHVIAICAEAVQVLLEAAPGLRVLATSREPLEVPGEAVWALAPMAVPDPGRSGLSNEDLDDYDAVQLFLDRARAARPGFAISEENQAHIARICWRVDGIPLALELAAGRVRTMTIDEIAAGLDHMYDLLTGRSRTSPPRHQTLQTTLDWSFEQLDDNERTVLFRLTALHLPFPRRAVEVVCVGDGLDRSDIVDALHRLVDTSWIVMDDTGSGTPYRMLQTVRQYLYSTQWHRWERRREMDQHELHKYGWVLMLAQRTDPDLKGSDREMWSTLLDGDQDIVRAALAAAFGQRAVEEGAFLAGAAAAIKSKTGSLGFIGGVAEVEGTGVERFLTGFEAGARHVDPSVTIDVRYLSRAPDWSGFWDRALLRDVAAEQYQHGLDVIMHAAGQAGGGLPEAARDSTEMTGTHRWCIGVDFDWYYDVPPSQREHVLTSVRFQIPTAVHRRLKDAIATGASDLPKLDLAADGVGLATSGGHLDDVIEEIEALRRQVIDGTIEVPAQ